MDNKWILAAIAVAAAFVLAGVVSRVVGSWLGNEKRPEALREVSAPLITLVFWGIVVAGVGGTGGITIGLLAGFAPKWLDTIIMRLMDVILAFPSLLLALVLVAILGPSLMNAVIAIAIVLQPHYVRLTRAAVISERHKDYVT